MCFKGVSQLGGFGRLSISFGIARIAKACVIFALGVYLFAPLSSQAQERSSQAQESCTVFTVPGTSDFDISAAANPAADFTLPPDAIVGEIVYTRLPIFNPNDPKESNRLFGLVDSLHIDTQVRIIKDYMLFGPGDAINARLLEESARELRRRNFLYDARIWTYRACGNKIDFEVVTREVWSISGGFSLSRSGGSDEESISLSDDNFLGRGETLAVSKNSSSDRSGLQILYSDPSLMGSRHQLSLFHVDNDDGGHDEFDLQRPFYSLDTRQAWGISFDDDARTIDLYDRGEAVSGFQSKEENSNVYLGFSKGWKNKVTNRWFVGWKNHKEAFEPDPNEPLPVVFPVDREFNYPYISYQSIQEDFIKTTNLNQIHRIEDFNLGRSWSASLGYASDSYGSDLDRVVYQADWRDAWQWNGTLMQLNLFAEGLWQMDNSESEDLFLESNWRYYDGINKKSGTYLSLDMKYSRNLPAHKQILLGAEENLRGYPSRFQDGDRSFVFSAERRYYTDWHLFRLLRVGGAVFFDVGRAWFPDEKNDGVTGVLADAGFGLRVASSRAQTSQVLHIDIAFPFDVFDDIDSVQVLITGKQSF